MRRIILGSALAICALLPAFSQTTCPATVFTPNLNLSLPALGTKNWNLCLNPNFQVIDVAIARLQSPFLGTWSSSTVYTKGSFVSFNNAIYISSIFSNFNNTPAAGSTAWQLFFEGGGGGSCGPNSDQPSSTDCGTANNVGTTVGTNTQTYGTNLNLNNANERETILIGNDSLNDGTVTLSDEVIGIGDNVLNQLAPSTGINDAICFGDFPCDTFSHLRDVIGIGDFTLQGNSGTDSVEDIVAIGDVVAEGLPDGSTADVYIGVAPGEMGNGLTGAPTETIGIGDSAADNSTGDENIAIGDSALDGGSGNPRGNTGHNNIAIGFDAIRANRTGSDNVAIGDQPGCVGCTGGNNGNGNRTGSNNVWIGNDAGQSVANTTEIDFSIAIGYQSQNAASNEARFGAEVETFDTYLFGTIHAASATSPTASAGTLVGTNNSGAISGLSAATSVTVTFAGGAGFTVWNSCTANASAASTPVAVSALSLTAVTFSFPSLTGSLYFHCDGN